MRDGCVQNRGINCRLLVARNRQHRKRRRRTGSNGQPNLAQTARSFVMSGTFWAAVRLDVRGLGCGPSSGDLIENSGRPVYAAVDQQHEHRNYARGSVAVHGGRGVLGHTSDPLPACR